MVIFLEMAADVRAVNDAPDMRPFDCADKLDNCEQIVHYIKQ
jgi:hypothetical protein